MNTKHLITSAVFFGSVIGCDDTVTCEAILYPRVTGTVIDADGVGLLPDRVVLLGRDVHECEIYPQGFYGHDGADPAFACFSGGDPMVIYYGTEVMEIDVPEGQDPCGADYPVLQINWNPE